MESTAGSAGNGARHAAVRDAVRDGGRLSIGTGHFLSSHLRRTSAHHAAISDSAGEVALAAVKGDFSRFLRMAADEETLITRHGNPAGVVIGFKSEEDWFEYRLEHHPEFLRRVSEARQALARGCGITLDSLEE